MFDHKQSQPVTRRDALRRVGNGFGMMAFAGMLGDSIARAGVTAAGNSGMGGVATLDYPQRVKRVIFLFMNGGLSTIDAFDPKPMLDKYDGKPMPGGSISTERRTGELMKSPYTFKKHGQCGMDVSDLWPHLSEVVDDICWVRSVYTEIPNHEPSCLMLNTGANQAGRPSVGAWVTYGLGTENKNLPGYVVLCPDIPTTVGPPLWSNGFLPAINQGTYISNKVTTLGPDGMPSDMPAEMREKAAMDKEGKEKLKKVVVEKDFDPKKILNYVNNPKFSLVEQRRELDLLQKLEKIRAEGTGADSQVEAVIQSMEIGYRMQTEAPDVFDIRKESQATLDLYGPGDVARGALTAVRLVEKGVRMVQLYYSKGDPWDAHNDILGHRVNAKNSDQAFAAVIKDLKSRGLWKDTLVVCGSEFGRTPVREVGGMAGGGVKRGRDHNPFGFTMWLAGGAVKGGTIYGSTDDFGFKAVEKPTHVHDIHATILYLMGIDHKKLTYRYSGRDFRLTDVAGNVLHDLIA